jgi:hypothetical protein
VLSAAIVKRIAKSKLSVNLETIATLDDVSGGKSPPRVKITTHRVVTSIWRKRGPSNSFCGHSFDPSCGIACP